MANASDIEELSALITIYFDALYYGDVEAFKRIMHPSAMLYNAADGELVHMDLPKYMDIVGDRPSPASRQDERYDRVLAMELASPTTAHIRVEDAYLPKRFIDDLTLVKIDDHWWIVSKVWHYF